MAENTLFLLCVLCVLCLFSCYVSSMSYYDCDCGCCIGSDCVEDSFKVISCDLCNKGGCAVRKPDVCMKPNSLVTYKCNDDNLKSTPKPNSIPMSIPKPIPMANHQPPMQMPKNTADLPNMMGLCKCQCCDEKLEDCGYSTLKLTSCDDCTIDKCKLSLGDAKCSGKRTYFGTRCSATAAAFYEASSETETETETGAGAGAGAGAAEVPVVDIQSNPTQQFGTINQTKQEERQEDEEKEGEETEIISFNESNNLDSSVKAIISCKCCEDAEGKKCHQQKFYSQSETLATIDVCRKAYFQECKNAPIVEFSYETVSGRKSNDDVEEENGGDDDDGSDSIIRKEKAHLPLLHCHCCEKASLDESLCKNFLGFVSECQQKTNAVCKNRYESCKNSKLVASNCFEKYEIAESSSALATPSSSSSSSSSSTSSSDSSHDNHNNEEKSKGCHSILKAKCKCCNSKSTDNEGKCQELDMTVDDCAESTMELCKRRFPKECGEAEDISTKCSQSSSCCSN